MWCPKCNEQYQNGITVCPQCGSPLTDAPPVQVDPAPAVRKADAYDRMLSRENMQRLSGGSGAYVEKSVRYEDMKATAGSFTLVGAGGFVVLALFLAGVFPIQFAAYMKVLMTAVMGTLFTVFLIVGIRAYQKLNGLKAQLADEQQKKEAASTWFFAHYSARSVDICAQTDETDALEQRYFLRSSCIRHILQEQFPEYSDAFCEYLLELFYEKLYPDDE